MSHEIFHLLLLSVKIGPRVKVGAIIPLHLCALQPFGKRSYRFTFLTFYMVLIAESMRVVQYMAIYQWLSINLTRRTLTYRAG